MLVNNEKFNMKYNLFWIVVTVCLLIGCSNFPSKQYELIFDASHLNNFSVMQQWDIKIEGDEYHSQMVAQTIEGGWQWVVLNDFGQRQATLTAKNGELIIEKFQSSQLIKHLDQLVMAWQFMFWPEELIQLSNHNQWGCEIINTQRKIYFKGEPYASILFEGSDMSNIKVEYDSRDMQISLSSYPLM